MKVKIDTVLDMENAVKCAFRKMFSCFSSDDTIVYEKVHRNVRIVYYSKILSISPSDLTCIELNFCLDTEDMWIGLLHVAKPFRSVGLGSQLVRAAEEVAHLMGLRNINVFPLHHTESFWLKMGYRPHYRTARVLSKYVNYH